MGSGFFGNMAHGHKARLQRRDVARRNESANSIIAASDARARECLAIAEDALSNGDSQTAQKFATEGNSAANLAADIRVAKLLGRW